jgi:glycosyltransferase involved in cell wall biosynthesis
MRSNVLRAPEEERRDDAGSQTASSQSVFDAAGRETSERLPRPLCVLLIVPELDGGAAAAGVLNLVRVLREAGHDAVVAAGGGRKADEVSRLGGRLVKIDVGSINPASMALNAMRLARLIRSHGCDIVHAHARAAAWSGYLASRLTQRPFMTSWYKGFRDQNLFKRFYNSAMARGERIVATSEQIGQLIQERYGACPLAVVPWGVDLQYFDPAGVTPARVEAVRQRFGVGERTKLVLVPARILRRKGHHVVVRAVERLKALGASDFACVFASEEAGTRYAGELWDQVLATQTADLIRLSGPVEDVAAAYAAATVVVSAAMQEDGLPRAVLEAQAMARPVIVSDIGAGPEALLAPPEVPEERMTGLRVPAGDADALAAAMVKVFAMPEPVRRAVGARGRAWVAGNFDPREAAVRMLRIYGDLAGRNPAETRT